MLVLVEQKPEETLQDERDRLWREGCEMSMEIEFLEATIRRIASVAKKYDTGEREYHATDWEFVLGQCEQVVRRAAAVNTTGEK